MQRNPFYIDRFISILAIYFLLQIIIRVLLSPNVGLDEAEQLLLTQNIAWGYNAQPPLYTWIQSFFFKIFGQNIFALALFKNILLFLTYFFYYKSALLISKEKTIALIATASLFLIPQISWESQRALTHSVLLTTIASISFYYFLYLKYKIDNFQMQHYTLLALLFTLGFLSKYSFVIFILALIIASLFDTKLKKFIVNRKIFITIILFIFLSLPHIVWVLNHLSLVTAPTLHKLQPIVGNYFKGIIQFFIALIEFLLLLLIPLLFFQRALILPSNTFIRNFFLSAIILLIFFIIATHASNFKDRWLQPYFFLLPLFIATKIDINRVSPKTLQRYFKIIYFLMLLVIAAPITRLYFPDIFKHPSRFSYPFADISKSIEKLGFQKGFIIAENKIIGGNMKIHFADSKVSADGFHQPLHSHQSILIVWQNNFPIEAQKFRNSIQFTKDIKVPFLHSKKSFLTLHIAIVKNL